MGEKLVQQVIVTSWKPFRHEEQGGWDIITSQILSTETLLSTEIP